MKLLSYYLFIPYTFDRINTYQTNQITRYFFKGVSYLNHKEGIHNQPNLNVFKDISQLTIKTSDISANTIHGAKGSLAHTLRQAYET